MILARCGGERPEDLLHFMWECPAYDHIRDEHAHLFEMSSAATVSSCMQGLFSIGHQRQLARCVSAMDVYRRHILGKGVLYGVRPKLQPQGYVATLAYPGCLSQAPPARLPAFLCTGMVGLSPEVVGITLGALVAALLCVFTCVVTCWCVSRLGTWWAAQST